MVPDSPHPLQLRFHGDLCTLLRKADLRQGLVHYSLTRSASIKDIIESLGIPHTEIGRLITGDDEVDFAFLPDPGDQVDVYPVAEDCLPIVSTVIRPVPIAAYRFLVDINVARLAGLLRMAGFDADSVQEQPQLVDKQAIAAAACTQGRILLSRDRDLLKLRAVAHGRLIRQQSPYRQLQEIVSLYRLQPLAKPFARCMACNHPLVPVAKEKIASRLKPLTKKYYHTFSQCSHCGKIYWQGSHYERMLEILKTSEVEI